MVVHVVAVGVAVVGAVGVGVAVAMIDAALECSTKLPAGNRSHTVGEPPCAI